MQADLKRYLTLSEENRGTTWIALQRDVFRPPSRPMPLTVLLGSGIQIFGTTVVTLGISSFFIIFIILLFFSFFFSF